MKKKAHNYYRVEKSDKVATIFLYNYIGDKDYWDGTFDNTDVAIVKEIESLCKTYDEVHLRINSSGGSTKHGAAIVTAIRKNAEKIHTYNDGVAYSMASEILLAAKKENIHIADNSMTMIHSASGYGYGNAKQLRDYASYLDKLTNVNAKYLSAKFGIDEAKFIEEYYDGDDHFLDANDMKAFGFQIDSYDSEGLPDAIDKKDLKAVRAYFEQKEKEETTENKGFFSSLFDTKKKGVTKPDSHKNELDMSKIDDVKTALENGEIKLEDVQALLDEKKANQPLTEKAITEIFDKKMEEIKGLLKPETPATPETPTETETEKQIKALQEQIEKLAKSDGGKPTPAGGKTPEEKKDLEPWEDINDPSNQFAIEKGLKWEKPADK